MPPRRPLPDVDLISVLKFLKPMDQLVASKMSPRLRLLVRAANRRVKTLVITDVWDDFDPEDTIDSFFISSLPILQQLTDDSGKAIDLQPKAVRANQWNCLEFEKNCHEELPTVEEIATVLFSAVTTLVFIMKDGGDDFFYENCQYLVSLLQHPHWATTQLQSLVLQLSGDFECTETMASGTYQLVTALNALSALQQLAVDFAFWFHIDDEHLPVLPALTVLAQLKVLVVNQAADNGDLQIHLQWSSIGPTCTVNDFAHWSEALLSRVVSLEDYQSLLERRTVEEMPCRLFPSLTSLTLSVNDSFSTNYRLWSTALSSQNLRQLLHLSWSLYLKDPQNVDRSLIETPPPRRSSLPRLTSVRALTLSLHLNDHSQAEWMHLPWTLPNCQVIYLQNFTCRRCDVRLCFLRFGRYHTEHSEPTAKSAAALQCLREFLFKLYPYFPHRQIILDFDDPKYPTVAELFAEQ
ncbi:hypothetical protein TYRP_003070 [Tyrophagus putrescentiae]|nr:hypothetical protein TYRP_003070 [Tyrophagus putrescentiae]